MANPQAASPSSNLTIAQATGAGQLVKSASLWYNSAVGAGATVQANFVTPDDNLLRFVLGFWGDVLTTGLFYRLLSSGRRMFDYSANGLSATHGPMGCYVPVAANVPIVVEMYNASGGSITPTAISLSYSVDDPNWTIGA